MMIYLSMCLLENPPAMCAQRKIITTIPLCSGYAKGISAWDGAHKDCPYRKDVVIKNAQNISEEK